MLWKGKFVVDILLTVSRVPEREELKKLLVTVPGQELIIWTKEYRKAMNLLRVKMLSPDTWVQEAIVMNDDTGSVSDHN